jgi:hypothetical protein
LLDIIKLKNIISIILGEKRKAVESNIHKRHIEVGYRRHSDAQGCIAYAARMHRLQNELKTET